MAWHGLGKPRRQGQFSRRLLNSCRSVAEAFGMADQVRWYRPREGAHLVVRVTRGGVNVCREVAVRLHNRYAEKCLTDNVRIRDFLHGDPYVLPGGLVFRLYDGGSGPDSWVLEFLADPCCRAERAVILAGLPGVLADAGVSGPCLDELRRVCETL